RPLVRLAALEPVLRVTVEARLRPRNRQLRRLVERRDPMVLDVPNHSRRLRRDIAVMSPPPAEHLVPFHVGAELDQPDHLVHSHPLPTLTPSPRPSPRRACTS